MDFWGLIGKSGKNRKKVPASEDEQRLERLKKEHLSIQRCLKTLTPKTRRNATIPIQSCIRNILRLLRDDARSSTQLALTYSLSVQIYLDVGRLSVQINDEGVSRDAISLFSFYLNNDLDNHLLASEAFAQALLELVNGILEPDGATDDTQVAALALVFDVTSKLRVYPEAVRAWFVSAGDGNAISETPTTIFEADTIGTSFPICQHLLNHVYQEGRAGDFARTGLLYIYDAATRSDQLEKWIIESDLPRLLASGLGALYSQLSRKLTILHPREELPLILALSEEGNIYEETDIESLYSPETQSQLTTFISYITFWRDMIDRCRSDSIKDTLVDNFHVFFLEQILYPTILESSDVDGGSAVAVLSYCSSLLEALAQEDLVHHMLHFLLALPGAPISRPARNDAPERPISRATMALEQSRKNQDVFSPSFFSLVDLILATLQSSNPEAVTAALRLACTILKQHHRYAIGSLVRVQPVKNSSARRTTAVMVQETIDLLQLAESIGGNAISDDAYENSLRDALSMIEAHDCSKLHASLGMLDGHTSDSTTLSHNTGPAVYKHRLRMDDPLMLTLLSLLDQFYVNEIETNLVLTEVIAHLASCPYLSLDGLLAAEPPVRQTLINARSIEDISFDLTEVHIQADENDEEELERQRIEAYRKACQTPPVKTRIRLSLVMILHKLNDDLAHATSNITDFKQLVASRRRAFEGAAEMEDDASRSSPVFSRRPPPSSNVGSPYSLSLPDKTQNAVGSPNDRSIAGMMPLGLPPLFELIAGKPKSTTSPTKPLSARTSHSTIGPIRSGSTGGNIPPSTSLPPVEAAEEFNVFEQSITFQLDEDGNLTPLGDEEDNDPLSLKEDQPKTTLSRVLTNVIILQDFILELTAIMQVRAGLFDGDVAFC